MDIILAKHAVGGTPFALRADDRFRHAFAIGATGTGKSTALLNIAAQDMARGDGLLLLDPHGDLADAALRLVPPHRFNHVCLLDPGDAGFPIGLNVLDDVAPDMRAVAADGVVAAMRGIWHDSWGPRMEYILRHALEALIETNGASLLQLPRLLTDADFRARIVQGLTSPLVKAFFVSEFEQWDARYRNEAIGPILNKVTAFFAVPSVRNMLGQGRSTLHLDHAMRNRRIVIANLAKGTIGESSAHLLGALLISRVLTHAMERAGEPEGDRAPFHVIADELSVFATEATARLLSEGRKMRVSLTAAAQTTAAIVRHTADGDPWQCGDACFLPARRRGCGIDCRRTGRWRPAALQDLGFGQAWGRPAWTTQAFPLEMPPPPEPLHDGARPRKQSRRHYGRGRVNCERQISALLGLPFEAPEDEQLGDHVPCPMKQIT